MKKRQVSTLFSPLAPKYTECSYVSVVLFSLFLFTTIMYSSGCLCLDSLSRLVFFMELRWMIAWGGDGLGF